MELDWELDVWEALSVVGCRSRVASSERGLAESFNPTGDPPSPPCVRFPAGNIRLLPRGPAPLTSTYVTSSDDDGGHPRVLRTIEKLS